MGYNYNFYSISIYIGNIFYPCFDSNKDLGKNYGYLSFCILFLYTEFLEGELINDYWDDLLIDEFYDDLLITELLAKVLPKVSALVISWVFDSYFY